MKYFLINLENPILVSDEPIVKNDWCLMFDNLGNLFLGDEAKQFLGEEVGHHLNKGLRKVIAGFGNLPEIDLNGFVPTKKVQEVRIKPIENNTISIVSNIVKVDVYEYKKTLIKNTEVRIPTEPVFYQMHNHREIVGIFPKTADWEGGDGSVWRLELVSITDKQILKATLDTNSKSLSDQVSYFDLKNKSQEDYFKDEVLKYIIKNDYGYGRVKYASYKAKLEEFISKLEIL